jgi:hypothetical protein
MIMHEPSSDRVNASIYNASALAENPDQERNRFLTLLPSAAEI